MGGCTLGERVVAAERVLQALADADYFGDFHSDMWRASADVHLRMERFLEPHFGPVHVEWSWDHTVCSGHYALHFIVRSAAR